MSKIRAMDFDHGRLYRWFGEPYLMYSWDRRNSYQILEARLVQESSLSWRQRAMRGHHDRLLIEKATRYVDRKYEVICSKFANIRYGNLYWNLSEQDLELFVHRSSELWHSLRRPLVPTFGP